MKKIGGWMFVFGVGSAILHLFGLEFRLLMWIEAWGPGMAWLIRGLLAVGGGLIWLTSRDPEASAD